MKVLYFHQHFSTPAGAVGIRSYRLASQLVARGHQVIMVCGSYHGGQTGLTMPFKYGVRRGAVDGLDVIEFDLTYSNNDRFCKRSFLFLIFALRSIGVVFNEKYDLVFATTTPLTAGIPGIFARWVMRKPFVFEVRDLWPELPKAMGVISNPFLLFLMHILEWVSYRSANLCIGLSPGIVEGIKKLGVSQNRVELLPNISDLSIFLEKSHGWRPKGVSETDLMAVFAGTHGVANGLDAVIDAAIELQKRNRHDIKIVLIGQGKLKAALQDSVSKHKLSNVIFHEPVDKARLAGLFTSADLGLQVLANIPAFYFGTSPNKFFDYLAAGLPVLNNYPGWVAEIIVTHQCGYAVAPDSPKLFADTLEAAAGDRAGLREMGRKSKALAKFKFDHESLSDRFVVWLETALKS
jgi:glycosyltransferase involved in cell wall biosynthesis